MTADALLGAPLPEATWIEPIAGRARRSRSAATRPTWPSRASRSGSRSWRRSSTCRRASAPCSSCARSCAGTADEVAELLDTSVASVNWRCSAPARRSPSRSAIGEPQPQPRRPPLDDEEQALLARYVDAFERYDMDALTSLLHEDATWSMPPYDLWLQTHDDIVRWCLGPGIGLRGLAPHPAPGQRRRRRSPSTSRPTDGSLAPWSLQVLDIRDGAIAGIMFFLDTARWFPVFGMPERLPAGVDGGEASSSQGRTSARPTNTEE